MFEELRKTIVACETIWNQLEWSYENDCERAIDFRNRQELDDYDKDCLAEIEKRIDVYKAGKACLEKVVKTAL